MGNRGNRAPASRRTGHAKWTKQGSFFLGTSANGTDSNAVCLRVATEPTEATGSRLGSQVGYQNRFFFFAAGQLFCCETPRYPGFVDVDFVEAQF